jgi:scyllo-inositol 2-dehydrogenase (NADP+)
MPDLGVAIIGYGLSGRFFHAPLVAATPGLKVASVVTSSEARRGQVAVEHPGATVLARAEDLWEQPRTPDLVVVATPNDSHAALASAALDHRVPVVVDKPLAITAADADAMVARAEQQGVLLTPFQNRRWDTDQLTLRQLLAENALGRVVRYESRFERWRPEGNAGAWRETQSPEQGGGLLLDLGSHLVDQALVLFGPTIDVYAEIEARRGGRADDDVFIALRHVAGPISHLWASAVAPAPGPRLRVQGTAAGFVIAAVDPQEDALRAGARPDTASAWGMPPDWEYGRLVTGEVSVPVPPEPGNWPRFYSLLRDALIDRGPAPVDPRDAVATLRVLEAARTSARERTVIGL